MATPEFLTFKKEFFEQTYTFHIRKVDDEVEIMDIIHENKSIMPVFDKEKLEEAQREFEYRYTNKTA